MDSLFVDEIRELSVDLIDNGINAIVESEVMQHIPIVKVINSFLKITVGVRERHFLSKVLMFLKGINQGNADEEEIEKRKIL